MSFASCVKSATADCFSPLSLRCAPSGDTSLGHALTLGYDLADTASKAISSLKTKVSLKRPIFIVAVAMAYCVKFAMQTASLCFAHKGDTSPLLLLASLYPLTRRLKCCMIFDTMTRIKERRKQLNMSQEILASLTGISRTHICLIERGKCNPTTKTLSKIAKALKVHVSYFFDQNV